MTTNLRERGAVVAAIFGHDYRSVQPFTVSWHDTIYNINQVSYLHRYHDGGVIYHVFSGTDGSNFFELKYHPEELDWLLRRIA